MIAAQCFDAVIWHLLSRELASKIKSKVVAERAENKQSEIL